MRPYPLFDGYGTYWTIEEMSNGIWKRTATAFAYIEEKDARSQCEELRRKYGNRVFRVQRIRNEYSYTSSGN